MEQYLARKEPVMQQMMMTQMMANPSRARVERVSIYIISLTGKKVKKVAAKIVAILESNIEVVKLL